MGGFTALEVPSMSQANPPPVADAEAQLASATTPTTDATPELHPDSAAEAAAREPAEVIAELTQKYASAQADYLRALAELDNYRKRAQREMEQARTFAIERFAAELLPVLDGFELGLKSATTDPQGFHTGQLATFRLLEKAFEKAGIRVIDPTGAMFDPNEHEAMVAVASPLAAGTVVETIQKGYVLATRLIRPARVVVAKADTAAL